MRKLLAPIAAGALILILAGTALAWNKITLTSECAPDENSYAWKISLPVEDNSMVDWSFDADFATFSTQDFGSAGDHEFTTPRGGPTLYVRWFTDHSLDLQAKADANAELCGPPPQPGIEIRKSNDAADTVEPGTLVTYTYEVENIGDTPLSDVVVKDQLAGSDNLACEVDSSDYSGDTNDNAILDIGETWTFTCSTALQVTTGNEACVSANVGDGVEGDQQPATVEDCDENEVEVSQKPEEEVEAGTGTPAGSVPNAAISTGGQSPLPTILFSLVLLTSLGTLAYTNVKVVARRKR